LDNSEVEKKEKTRKLFNAIVMDIIKNCDISFGLIALFKELRESMDTPSATLPFYTLMILKCLVISSKRIQCVTSDVFIDFSKILKEVHLFYLKHPLASWSNSDKSILNFIKNFLNEIIKLKKSEILHYLEFLVTSHTPHDIYLVIDKLLEKNGLPSKKLQLSILIKNSQYGPLSQNMEREELVKILTVIYRTIFNKDTFLQGLADLAVLIHYNPALPIDRYIQSSTTKLSTYVEKGLKKFNDIDINLIRTSDHVFNLAPATGLSIEDCKFRADEAILLLKTKLALTTPSFMSVNTPFNDPNDTKRI